MQQELEKKQNQVCGLNSSSQEIFQLPMHLVWTVASLAQSKIRKYSPKTKSFLVRNDLTFAALWIGACAESQEFKISVEV